VPELTLRRVEPGLYALGDIGTLRGRRRFNSDIEAGGTTWRIRRAALGLGQIITATDAATGTRAARYVPRGRLHMRGIYGGVIQLDERTLDWDAQRRMSSHFTVREDGAKLAEFDAGSNDLPVTVALFGLHHLEPLPLLFCCHIVKQIVDMTMEVGTMGPPPPN
jgi:hypothetical protein